MNAALLVGVEPASIAALSVLFLGERLSAARAAAIALGLSGALFIVWQGVPLSSLATGGRARGGLLLLAHGFFWALCSVIGKPSLRRLGAMDFSALMIVFAAIAAAALAWPWDAGARVWPVNPAAWGALLFLALGVGVLGVAAWNKALGLMPASTRSPSSRSRLSACSWERSSTTSRSRLGAGREAL